MKVFVVAFLAFASHASAGVVAPGFDGNSAYGYLENVGIPEAERIRKAEESAVSRVDGEVPASLEQIKYEVGLILYIIESERVSVCNGALVSANRVVTAAHCWFDGRNQVGRITVVLGSSIMFSGGTRIETNDAFPHPDWDPRLVRNDVAVVYLPTSVSFSDTIGPVALPSGPELNEDFTGELARASYFDFSGDGDSSQDYNVQVISNSACISVFSSIIQPTNICTQYIENTQNTCSGNSGSPLAVTRNDRPLMIGVLSLSSAAGCQAHPNAYARVTSFIDFINQHIL